MNNQELAINVRSERSSNVQLPSPLNSVGREDSARAKLLLFWFGACPQRGHFTNEMIDAGRERGRAGLNQTFAQRLPSPDTNCSRVSRTAVSALRSGRYPPALPGFDGTTNPSVTPSRPACPSRASGWASRSPTPWAFPCCAVFLFHACHRHYPAEPPGTLFARFPSGGSLPRKLAGSASALIFSRPAQRLLTLRPACSPSPFQDPLHRRLQSLGYLRDCSDCYRLERTLPGGICTHGKTVPLHGALTD
jgi:hypothetical protein